MVRLLLLSLCLTACAGAPLPLPPSAYVAPTLDPFYALQDAQATGTAAARSIDATATAQVNFVATEARASIALAEAQTQAAIPGMQTATAIANSLLVATATEGASHNATQIAATLTADTLARERENLEANLWLGVGGLAVIAVAVAVCLVVIRIGYAWEGKIKAASIVIIRNGDAPVGYLMPGPTPRYHSLTGGQPVALESEPDPDRQCRDAWRQALLRLANDAARLGSWSVNTLSTRDGAGEWPEDTVQRAQAICADIGALVNYGGTRGWDWAGDWNYLSLRDALDNGVYFALPFNDSGAPLWPVLPEQSKAQHSKAKPPKAKRSAVPT